MSHGSAQRNWEAEKHGVWSLHGFCGCFYQPVIATAELQILLDHIAAVVMNSSTAQINA